MATTLIALYDRADQAQKAIDEFAQAGLPGDKAQLLKQQGGQDQNAIRDQVTQSGMPQEMASLCAEAVSRGQAILLFEAPEDKADNALEIMRRNGSKKFDELEVAAQRAGQEHGSQPHQQHQAHQEGRETVPVVEEQVSIGKRKVMRGGFRVVTTVTERPVEETVRLREEKVEVRHDKVDRPLSPEEAERAFQNRTVEMTESAEEAEVRKQARVVEEVSLERTVQEHEQQIHEKARRSDVKVEKRDR